MDCILQKGPTVERVMETCLPLENAAARAGKELEQEEGAAEV